MMLSRRAFAGGAAALLSDAPAAARASGSLEGVLQGLVARDEALGACAVVWREGRPDHWVSVGARDPRGARPIGRDSIFRIASMTKPLTAVAVLRLVERGQLRLADPVTRWLPELAERRVLRRPDGPLDDTVPAARDITVHDLLAFRSGYGIFGPPGPFAEAMAAASTADLNRLDSSGLLAALKPIPLQFGPGERWIYDTSADLAGVVVERVTGRRLATVFDEEILGPLQMADTGFFVPPRKTNRVAQRYSRRLAGFAQDLPLQTRPPKLESGAHGLYSTAPDYLRFARMLLGRGAVDGVRILRAETMALMARPTQSPADKVRQFSEGKDWGLGIGVWTSDQPAGPSAGALGWSGATGTWFVVDPVRRLAAVVMVQRAQKLLPALGGPPADFRFEIAPLGEALGAVERSVYGALSG